ncbi:MAG: hypothetical protein C0501_15595 [Isosphaera sp.]|nr:hypothetical protein [Isosphaera sp.]
MSTLLRYLRNLVAVEDARKLDDRALLRRFVEHRDGAAFAALVDRHAPLVLAACRRLLPNEQDAEDVLQATFLVLVRKAGSVRRHESVGSWLYGTAYLLARKARTAAARRAAREREAAGARRRADPPRTWDDLGPVLDEELAALPDKYRAPLLLCGLQGKSRDEAARELGWAPGAVKIRLERGRELLRSRLARRGVTLSVAFLTTSMTAAAVPARLAAGTVDAAVRSAAGEALPASAAGALAGGLLREAAVGKLGLLAGLLAVGLAAGGVHHLSVGDARPAPGVVAAQAPVSPPAPAPEPPPVPEVAPAPVPREKPPESGATVAAVVRGVQPDRGTVTVRAREVDTTYPVAAGADLRVDGRPAVLTDFKPPYRVKVRLSADGSEVAALATEGAALAGTLRAVGRNAVTVEHLAESARTTTTTWPLDPAATVPPDLAPGRAVAVQLSADRKRVLAVTAGPP